MFCGIFSWLWYDLLMLFTCFVMFLCGSWRFRIKYSWMLQGKEWICFLQDTYEVRGWSLKTGHRLLDWHLYLCLTDTQYFLTDTSVFLPQWKCICAVLSGSFISLFSSFSWPSGSPTVLKPEGQFWESGWTRRKALFPQIHFLSDNNSCLSSVMIAMFTCIQCEKLVPIIDISLDIGQKSDWQQCVEPNFVDNCDNQNRICISCSCSTSVERSKEPVNWRCNEYVGQLEAN